jgi:hypothetical protein
MLLDCLRRRFADTRYQLGWRGERMPGRRQSCSTALAGKGQDAELGQQAAINLLTRVKLDITRRNAGIADRLQIQLRQQLRYPGVICLFLGKNYQWS